MSNIRLQNEYEIERLNDAIKDDTEMLVNPYIHVNDGVTLNKVKPIITSIMRTRKDLLKNLSFFVR